MVATILNFDKGAGLAAEGADQMRRCFFQSHDVGDDDRTVIVFSRFTEQCFILFFGISDDGGNFWHCRKRSGINLCCTTRHNNPCIGATFARLPDRLPRLPHSFVGDGTTVDDNKVAFVRKLFGKRVALR